MDFCVYTYTWSDNLFNLAEKLSHLQGWQTLFFNFYVLISNGFSSVTSRICTDKWFLRKLLFYCYNWTKLLNFSEGGYIPTKYCMGKNNFHIIKISHTRALRLYICLCRRIYFVLLYRNNGKSSEAHCDQ